MLFYSVRSAFAACRPVVVAAMCLGLLSTSLQAASCGKLERGINLAGPAFATERLPGQLGHDYKFPTPKMMAYYRGVGFTSVRLSILWERLQPELLGPLDRMYLNEVKASIELAGKNGFNVVVDLHNYGRYRNQLIGSAQVPNDAFKDIWRRLVSDLGGMPAISGWGLMNEPYRTEGLWPAAAQAGLNGIREVDKARVIYVAGDSFSSAARWPTTHPRPFVMDPSNNEVYEAHLYLDEDASGKYHSTLPTGALSPSQVAQRRMKPFTDWLVQFGKRGMIGEYGAPAAEPLWIDGISALLDLADKDCISTYVWAGGAWSPGYKLSLEPVAGEDKPLTAWFRKRFAAQQQGKP